MAEKRSGSSRELRDQLKKDYVILPKVDKTVDLTKYLTFAKGILDEAVQCFAKRDLTNSYINYSKFATFIVVDLVAHPDYRNAKYAKYIQTFQTAAAVAVQNLEQVVAAMDEEEDLRLRDRENSELVDLFEEDEFDVSAPTVTDHAPVALPIPVQASVNDICQLQECAETKPAAIVPGAGLNAYDLANLPSLTLEDRPKDPYVQPLPPIPPCAASAPSAPSASIAASAALETLSDVPNTISSRKINAPIPARSEDLLSAALGPLQLPSTLPQQHVGAPQLRATSVPSTSISLSNYRRHVSGLPGALATPANLIQPQVSLPTPQTPTSMVRAEVPYDRFAGITMADLEILRRLRQNINRFSCPPPSLVNVMLRVGARSYVLIKHDFHVSFSPFLMNLPPELQMSRSALETNRCFFLHLGIAVQIHPFVLEIMFRHITTVRLQNSSQEDFSRDILSSVIEYSGFVDANSLCFLWPTEFNGIRICVISGSFNSPMFSCFSVKSVPINRDIIIHCDGSHFTLLASGVANDAVLQRMLNDAKAAGLIVQQNEIDLQSFSSKQPSIYNLMQSL